MHSLWLVPRLPKITDFNHLCHCFACFCGGAIPEVLPQPHAILSQCLFSFSQPKDCGHIL
jgi:hypothetical protein